MEYAIFCLLAFCIFQTAFADKLQQDLENLNYLSMRKIYGTLLRLGGAVENAIDAGGKKGVPLQKMDHCRDEYSFWYLKPECDQCQECHKKATKARNIKLARKCCVEIIAAVEKQGKIKRAIVNACVAKAIHETQAAAVGKPRRGVGRPRGGIKKN